MTYIHTFPTMTFFPPIFAISQTTRKARISSNQREPYYGWCFCNTVRHWMSSAHVHMGPSFKNDTTVFLCKHRYVYRYLSPFYEKTWCFEICLRQHIITELWWEIYYSELFYHANCTTYVVLTNLWSRLINISLLVTQTLAVVPHVWWRFKDLLYWPRFSKL